MKWEEDEGRKMRGRKMRKRKMRGGR